jgi:ribosomal protein L39E
LRLSFCAAKENGRYPGWITASEFVGQFDEALSRMAWRNNSDNDEGNSIEYDGLMAQHQIHWRDKKLEMILLHHVQVHG